MKMVLPFGLCCAGFVALFAGAGFVSEMPAPQIEWLPATLHLPQKEEPEPITLLFVGDVMLDRGVELAVKKDSPTGGGGDWTWLFAKIADQLQQADLLFGNLESQISDKGTNVGSIYSFRANPASLEALASVGFDLVSVANNHSFDYTREAFEDSRARLREAGITPVADALAIKEVKETKIGFLAYSNFPGPARADWNTLARVLAEIAQAKRQVDILAVSVHAGEEYAKEPNEFQRTFYSSTIEAGADLVVGHHPHVVQPLEQHQQGWIAWSLGNFLFDQDFSEETMKGAILKVVVENKAIKEASLVSTRISPSFQVELAE